MKASNVDGWFGNAAIKTDVIAARYRHQLDIPDILFPSSRRASGCITFELQSHFSWPSVDYKLDSQ